MATQGDIKQEVRRRYGEAAKKAAVKDTSGGPSAAAEAELKADCCGGEVSEDVITSDLYATDELQHLPQEAVIASLGCGNPVAVADLREGETVLDLGSGGGIDVLLSARRVGPQGKAYGLDMTDEMLELARQNARKAGVANVEFVKGEMEEMPLPDGEVDVIISNCVVNLSPDKDAVLGEAFRVLKPGGRIAIADIVTHDDLPPVVKESMALWTGCIAGALTEREYADKLTAAGFEDIAIESFREYTAADAEAGGPSTPGDAGLRTGPGEKAKEPGAAAQGLGIFSAVVRATKPGGEPSARRERIPVVASERQAGGNCC